MGPGGSCGLLRQNEREPLIRRRAAGGIADSSRVSAVRAAGALPVPGARRGGGGPVLAGGRPDRRRRPVSGRQCAENVAGEGGVGRKQPDSGDIPRRRARRVRSLGIGPAAGAAVHCLRRQTMVEALSKSSNAAGGERRVIVAGKPIRLRMRGPGPRSRPDPPGGTAFATHSVRSSSSRRGGGERVIVHRLPDRGITSRSQIGAFLGNDVCLPGSADYRAAFRADRVHLLLANRFYS